MSGSGFYSQGEIPRLPDALPADGDSGATLAKQRDC